MFPLDDDGRYATDNETGFLEAWEVMETLVDEGKVRCIGLSNFNQAQIRDILTATKKHKPAILQNEGHPYLQNKDMLDFCRAAGIQFQAYSPLGSFDRPWAKEGSLSSGLPISGHELLKDPALVSIAKKYNKSVAQVVLRWHTRRGCCACPKSTNAGRIKENISIFDFTLTPQDIAVFDRLNIGWRHCIWAETSRHPDYPFKDWLPCGYVAGKAPKATASAGQ
eukprot:CAMPEP_0168515882 /NCGR_PEP_ID=MMETSP0405-20121227/5067_1 /TAXON_ID=498012 /ORGANISM="Trichosphaerium sp, Strain Am-I-7 wt" /LENGTH=222 /DNA_ID=CAMNT_0008535479 /DNA_START=146 /DNA_END=814 /DNA_ORIENTATION=+